MNAEKARELTRNAPKTSPKRELKSILKEIKKAARCECTQLEIPIHYQINKDKLEEKLFEVEFNPVSLMYVISW